MSITRLMDRLILDTNTNKIVWECLDNVFVVKNDYPVKVIVVHGPVAYATVIGPGIGIELTIKNVNKLLSAIQRQISDKKRRIEEEKATQLLELIGVTLR